jgi:hypothetical protein
MLVLFDHGTPRGLARELPGHEVSTAKSKGWDRLSNGELLKAAEEAGFQVLLTTDGNINKISLEERLRLLSRAARQSGHRCACIASGWQVRLTPQGRPVTPKFGFQLERGH